MRVERAYYSGPLGNTLNHSRKVLSADRPREVELHFYSAGEEVMAGQYRCTFCGHNRHQTYFSPLPLCSNCDSSEYPSADLSHQSASVFSPFQKRERPAEVAA